MSFSCVHLCFNFLRCEGTKNTRFNISNCSVYFADSCLISRFLALFTSSRSRVLAYLAFSCSRDVFSFFACPRLLANSSPGLCCVLTIYFRKLTFSYSRVFRVFFTFSLINLADSHFRPERENTRERGYEVRRISHHTKLIISLAVPMTKLLFSLECFLLFFLYDLKKYISHSIIIHSI